MLDGKLRIGLTRYHPLHIGPIAQDLLEAAFADLRRRKELEPESLRVKAVAERWGY